MALHQQNDIVAGRYEVFSILGSGGLGEVYLCKDIQSNDWVALKRLREDIDLPAPILEQTRHEASTLSSLKHRNIIRVLDFGIDPKGFFFVLEYVNGPSLSTFMKQGRIETAIVQEIAQQSLEGLSAAHRAEILHLDIKPANIMLSMDQDGGFLVKILDFGIAKLFEEAMPTPGGSQAIGSVYYMAPEQIMRQSLDERTDIYSLGHVFYELFSGVVAFGFTNKVIEIARAHLEKTPDLLHTLRPDLDTELCNWVHWLMNREPDQRPQNAQVALHVLTRIIVGEKSRKQKTTTSLVDKEIEEEKAGFFKRFFNKEKIDKTEKNA